MTDHEITTANLARLFGVTPKTMADLGKRGIIERAGRGRWLLEAEASLPDTSTPWLCRCFAMLTTTPLTCARNRGRSSPGPMRRSSTSFYRLRQRGEGGLSDLAGAANDRPLGPSRSSESRRY